MTDNEIQVAIAEACGTMRVRSDGEFKNLMESWLKEDEHPHSSITRPGRIEYKVYPLPDFPNDLNAMNEAVATLEIGFDGSQADDYQQTLWGIVNPGISFHEIETITDVGYLQRFVEATARQRAEAFLKTIGKWKEEP